MNDSSDRARAELVAVARALLAGDLDLLSGCRRLDQISARIEPLNRQIFNPIISFVSETDGHPLGEIRNIYNKAYLDKLDRQLADFSERARSGILDSCRLIIAEYG
jgi:hypothetical protein